MSRLNNTAQAQTEVRDGRSKPRTIIRMLSTKFKPPSVPALRSPPSAPSAYSKEQRDAALRARGLLPPLPNKDLSAQEQEQDQFIPIVKVAESEKQPDDADHPSAADLIKKEWVAKNNTDDSSSQQQQNHMKDFKFGGCSPALEVEESRSSRPHQAVSPTKSEIPSSSPPALSESGSSPASSRELVQPPKPSSPTMERPSSLLAEFSEEIQAFMFPLPPSPSSSSLSPSPSQSEPKAPSPLQSPSQQSTTPHHPNDDKSGGGGSGSGTSTPRPPATCATVSEPEAESPAQGAPPTEPTSLLRPGNRDSCGGQTEESHSDASIMTPSLDSTSQTMSSSSHGSASLSAAAPGRKGGLHVKTANREGEPSEPDTTSVSVAIASPTSNPMADHRFSEELGVVVEEESRPPSPSPSPLDSSELGVKLKVEQRERDARPPAVNTHSVSSGTDMDKPAAAKAKTVERKRSMNPFKRAGTVVANEKSTTNAESLTPTPRRRLTVATSFSMSNIRRSVVESLSGRPSSKSPSSAGPRSAPMRGETFDASHLPPSPTSPFSAGGRASTISTGFKSVGSGGRTMPVSPVSPTPRVRQPVVMYNRGSILLEAAGIEDEESRRMTELAFLG